MFYIRIYTMLVHAWAHPLIGSDGVPSPGWPSHSRGVARKEPAGHERGEQIPVDTWVSFLMGFFSVKAFSSND